MMSSTILQAETVLARLDYQRDFSAKHISDFALAAMNGLLGVSAGSTMPRRDEAEQLASVVDEQLALEEELPPGVRTMRFVHHPARVIVDRHRAREFSVPVRQAQILEWLRQITRWGKTLDDLIATAIGISLPIVATKLASVAKADPVTFFALICFEFDHPDLDNSITCDPVQRKHGERRRPFHESTSLSANMRMIAEWSRAIEIARFNETRKYGDADLLMAVLLGRPHKGQNFDWDLDTVHRCSPLTVPTLFEFFHDESSTLRSQLNEYHRVLSGKPRRGPRSVRPVFHYYGLGPAEMLAVAFLDLVRCARGIKPNGPAIGKYKPRSRHPEDFGDDALKTVIESVMAECGCAIWLKQDFALRARALRDRYAREFPVYGSACRFDPRFWLYPTRDASMLERLTTFPCPDFRGDAEIPDRFMPTTALVRNILLALLGMQIDSRNVPRAAEVAAHLLSSATILTRDPTLFAFLEHSMDQSGYRPRRTKKSPPSPTHAGAGRWFGCHMPPYNLSKRQFPEFPRPGARPEFYKTLIRRSALAPD